MRLDLLWNDETLPLDLVDGEVTVGGGAHDDLRVEALPPGLLTLTIEGPRLTVLAQRSVQVGAAVFPAKVPRLLLEGEALTLSSEVVLKRVLAPERQTSRRQMATAFVAKELLSGEISAHETRAATLTCVTGQDAGRVFPLPFDDNVIGRAMEAPIRLRDRAVSRQHARLVRERDAWVVRIIETSMNGVYVNGLLLKKPRALETGDVLEVGQTLLRFDDEVEDEAPGVEVVTLPAAAAPAPTLRVSGWRAVPSERWLVGGGAVLAVLGVVVAVLAR